MGMSGSSCADQLFGDQNRYAEVRRNAVNYIRSHKKDYLPFMDQDSEPFEQVHFGGLGLWIVCESNVA